MNLDKSTINKLRKVARDLKAKEWKKFNEQATAYDPSRMVAMAQTLVDTRKKIQEYQDFLNTLEMVIYESIDYEEDAQ